CQSGMWAKQSKSSYFDSFTGGYIYTPGGCLVTSAPCYVRRYTLKIKSPSTIISSLITNIGSGQYGSFATAGIGVKGKLCGYNANMSYGAPAHVSSACVINLEPGDYVFEFSSRSESGSPLESFSGSIAVWPL
ncbi:hypothetical protein QO202_22750, partial [Aeromonas caviae]|uniref:hypothetical protein n=1 Tax=Aeromonas caviae TaxID=648 RepID=UPI002648B151